MQILQKFGENLGNTRRSKKMTQEKLAEKVGITVAYLSLLERGKRNPPLTRVDELARALGVTAADLVA